MAAAWLAAPPAAGRGARARRQHAGRGCRSPAARLRQLLLQLRVHHGAQAGQQGAQARQEVGVALAALRLKRVRKVDQAHAHLQGALRQAGRG